MPESVGQDLEGQAIGDRRYLFGPEREPSRLTMEYPARFHTGAAIG